MFTGLPMNDSTSTKSLQHLLRRNLYFISVYLLITYRKFSLPHTLLLKSLTGEAEKVCRKLPTAGKGFSLSFRERGFLPVARIDIKAGSNQTRRMGVRKKRLDEILVDRGLAESRNRAKALIMGGKVRNGTRILDKAGKEFPHDLKLEVEAPPRYVSRGADKLEGFFARFPWPLQGKRFLDVGASTGGFTDYLLQAGALEAICVDVGHGQLHYRLRTDPRIHNLERVNARSLKPAQLPYPDYPLIVMDLSFISLKQVLPAAWKLLEEGGRLIALVKPQFEAGKEEADRFRGVITDPEIRARILSDILGFARGHLHKASEIGVCESPLKGMSGNVEYLAGWERLPPRGS